MRGHRFVLKIETDPETTTSDDEGRPNTGAPAVELVRGNLSMLSAREAYRAKHYGEDIDAAAHLPSKTVISHQSRIILDQDLNPHIAVPAELAGTWKVGSVRHTRPLLRVLLRRSEHP